jgi:hypothetical protein
LRKAYFAKLALKSAQARKRCCEIGDAAREDRIAALLAELNVLAALDGGAA